MFRYEEHGQTDLLPATYTNTKFLVFSLPRCGSTTLQRILNCHPYIRCLEEPFNPFNYDRKYFRRVTDLASLDETLRDIWSTYQGIKHTWDLDGWPFPNDKSLNSRLLLKPKHRVLYLRRRNLLRRLVSFHISNQTGVWGLFEEHNRKRLAECDFAPMDVESAQSRLKLERGMLSYYEDLLLNNGSTFMNLWYEDLFDPKLTLERQLDLLNKIFSFLGQGPIREDTELAQLHELFDGGTMKLNSLGTYRRIPGIEELERRCGADEVGWLFQDS
jgi:hypothetical protein